jgi:alkylation response protein AidB-like acyl-CoA dehydrogenase
MTSARSAEQEQFAAALHDLLTGGAAGTGGPGDGSLRAARRWAAGDRSAGLALWRKLAGAGVTALAVPERCGGLGASPLDLMVACEELGHHALPGPVAESLAAVPGLLAALDDQWLGDDGQRARWLAALAAGDLMATLALPPRRPYAADADAAGLVLLVEDDAVWLAAPGARYQSVDPARCLAEACGRQLLARGPAVSAAARHAFDLGALACAAQLLGAGRALLAASVRHARQRVQFGRPVGSFQAVKHQLADVAIGLEFAAPLLDAAALALADRGAGAARDVSAAKIACAGAAHRAARTALQVHGAIGYTQEHDLGLWLTKIRALVPAWGTQSEHRARVMACLAADGGQAWN